MRRLLRDLRRWLTGRLYRKMILSHILVMLALFLLMGGVLRLFYMAYVQRALRSRFWAQTTLLLQRLEASDPHLHYDGLLEPPDDVRRRKGRWRRWMRYWYKPHDGHGRWWPRRRKGEKKGSSGGASTRSAVSSLPSTSKGSVKRSEDKGEKVNRWLSQTWVRERLRAWSLLLNVRLLVHQKDAFCWMEVRPRRLSGVMSVSGRAGLYSQVMLRAFGEQRCPRRLRRLYRHYRRHRTPFWAITRSLRIDGVGKVDLTFVQVSPIELERPGIAGPLALLVLFVGLALLTIPMSRNISRPLRHLMERVKRIPAGDLAEPIEIGGTDEVAELAQTIEEMRRSLLRLHEQRAALLSDISHEMRTPLARIRMVTESVADGLMREPAALERAMEGVCVQVDEVNQMLGDLLELARFEVPSKQLLELQSLDLEALLEERRQNLSLAAETRGVKIALEIEQRPLPTVQGDARRLKQVVNNLVQNAMRYSPEGGSITVRVSKKSTELCVEVEDQGPGVPEAERERIFERFVRLDASRSRKTGHQGLGLAIVKQLIESHGGHVGVRDNAHGGASFWFTLPYA
ncbi:MAG: HAMP domain-containing histidine kinase [Myxococcales bacterium]|nr:HAMP domain-containing histidine kinase [Myxococcales bacterium]